MKRRNLGPRLAPTAQKTAKLSLLLAISALAELSRPQLDRPFLNPSVKSYYLWGAILLSSGAVFFIFGVQRLSLFA